ncbi:uncharacterized protein LOC108487724 [Gossypium arboreum]|uniref:uncharacterized protein LOC108487724 n=1 Tax=Gossypium arboreum TaxID=29729 RepID=UPI000819071E|nr:uncharacterized protein LOC108487724 [Gossypium arboreum]
MDTSETPVSPTTKIGSGSHDRVAGDDAQSQAMLWILEKKLKGVVSLLRDEAYQWWLTVKESTQPDRLTWDYFKTTYKGKYVGANYIDDKRREFLNLTQENHSVAKYEAKFLRLIRYARGMVATEYERCVKIAEEVKRAERQNREKGKNKRELEPSSSAMRPKKKVKPDGPVRVRVPIVSTRVALCGHYGRCHSGECWRTTRVCLRCGSTEHRVRDCLLSTDQMQASVTGTVQPPRVVQQPHRSRGQDRGGNGMDIGSTHSYVASIVSETLGIPVESTFSEVTVLVKHRVSLDCVTKRVVLKTEEDVEVVVIGEHSRNSSVKDIRILRDFPDVFLEELPGLPLSCEVEFEIELFSGIALVSIAPYRMAPKELTKLKALRTSTHF